jgi:hypothetical protein
VTVLLFLDVAPPNQVAAKLVGQLDPCSPALLCA